MNKRKRTPVGDAKFFGALEGGHTVEGALTASGYSRTAVYAWRKRYPRFAAAWANADEVALAALEAGADRRVRARAPRVAVGRAAVSCFVCCASLACLPPCGER